MMQLSIPLSPIDSRQVLALIERATSDQPASIRQLSAQTGYSARALKQVVESARIEGAPICARRGKPCGYFYGRTAEELEGSARVLVNQAKSMLLAAGRLVARHRVRELLGQEVFNA